ncbi:MAG: ABC transporter permease subunit, partial [Haloarculaceae archaeon]
SRLVYLGGSIPVFFSLAVAYAFLRYQTGMITPYDADLSPLAWPNLRLLGIASLVLAVSLVSVQMRYARAEALSYAGSQMVKLVRAKGGGPLELFRHVGRLAALPLLSLFFSETLAAMYLSVYVVEVTLGIPGFGQFVYAAIENRTFSVILAATMVTIVVGVFGNLVQDVTYTVLDPRVEG